MVSALAGFSAHACRVMLTARYKVGIIFGEIAGGSRLRGSHGPGILVAYRFPDYLNQKAGDSLFTPCLHFLDLIVLYCDLFYGPIGEDW